jgi:hypothetical protein
MTAQFDSNQNFYVRHLPIDDRRRAGGKVYQIQVVDRNGLATEFAYLNGEEERLEIDGRIVPVAVIKAAKRQEPGRGDFVDIEGNQVLPKDF